MGLPVKRMLGVWSARLRGRCLVAPLLTAGRFPMTRPPSAEVTGLENNAPFTGLLVVPALGDVSSPLEGRYYRGSDNLS